MSGPSLLAFVMAGGEGSRRQPLTAERTNSSVPFVACCRMVDPALSDQIDPGIYSIYPLAVDADEHGHIRGILEMPAEPLAMPGRSGHACDIGRDRQRHQVTESGTVVMHRGIPRGAARITDGVS